MFYFQTGISPILHHDIPLRSLNNLPDIQPLTEAGEVSIEGSLGLNSEGERLTISYPAPRPIEKIARNVELIKEHLDATDDDEFREIYRKAFDNVKILSFEEEYAGLATCLSVLLKTLKPDQKLTVATCAGKSSFWMTQMAIELGIAPHLDRITTYPVDTVKGSSWNIRDLKKSKGEVTLFDDASYSGAQAAHLISTLGDRCEENNLCCHLTMVIPFISDSALNYISLASQTCLPRLNVTLITTDKRLPNFKQILEAEERDLWFHNRLEEIESECVALPEWKLPDEFSFPASLAYKSGPLGKKYYFFGNPTPPYKLSTESR